MRWPQLALQSPAQREYLERFLLRQVAIPPVCDIRMNEIAKQPLRISISSSKLTAKRAEKSFLNTRVASQA